MRLAIGTTVLFLGNLWWAAQAGNDACDQDTLTCSDDGVDNQLLLFQTSYTSLRLLNKRHEHHSDSDRASLQASHTPQRSSRNHANNADAESVQASSIRELPRILHVGSRNATTFPNRDNWVSKNPGWTLDFLTDDRIEDLYKGRFPNDSLGNVAKLGVEKSDIGRLPALQKEGDSLGNVAKLGVEKSDIGRLLALQKEGGVYVDSDVVDLVPIDQWLARYHYKETPDLIMGVEFPKMDATNGNALQLTNWAMAAMPGNSILGHAINKIFDEAPDIQDTQENILARTGPKAVTSGILEALRDHGVKLPDMAEFEEGHGHLFHIQEKDGGTSKVLILPYRAFGYPGGDGLHGDPVEDRLVHHMFDGSWREEGDPNKIRR